MCGSDLRHIVWRVNLADKYRRVYNSGVSDAIELQAARGDLPQRTMNARRLFDLAWSAGPLTATELMAGTGLTRATVLSICRDLVAAGWFQEVADARAAGAYAKGRPARRHAFRPDDAFVVACDADEDLCTVAVADLHGVELTRVSKDVVAIRGALERRRLLRRLVDEALEGSGIAAERIAAAVIGVPAPVGPEGASPPPDDAEGCWTAMNPGLATLFQERGWRVRVDNDANLAALCEAADGAGVRACQAQLVSALSIGSHR